MPVNIICAARRDLRQKDSGTLSGVNDDGSDDIFFLKPL
jgi:hypothetical protein